MRSSRAVPTPKDLKYKSLRRLLLQPTITPGGPVTAEGVVTIILGSTVVGTVLGTLLGARLEADNQREEAFRQKMVDSAVEFLKHVTAFYGAVYAADEATQRSRGVSDGDQEDSVETALTAARKEIMEATAFVPVQRVVFPGTEVPDAATDLVRRMNALFDAVAEQRKNGSGADLDSEYASVDRAHKAYATLVNHAIREAAFRPSIWHRRGSAHRARKRAAGREPVSEPGTYPADSPPGPAGGSR